MAVYPAGLPGVYPIDPDTTVGQFRLRYGDVVSVAYSPVEAGFQDYTTYSDDEIESFLTAGGDSPTRAIGYAYLQAAGAAALVSKSVADYDLKISTEKRAEDLRKMALLWFSLANDEDALTGDGSYFEIVETDIVYPRIEAETTPYLSWP